jgi:ABC-type branched-subunit amino acid transport system substrate-binding protein
MRRANRVAPAGVALVLALFLAACGSNLDPDDVQGLGSNGTAQDGTGDTGTGDTGTGDTGTGDTGTGDTGTGDTGTGDTGTGDTGAGDTGTGDTGSDGGTQGDGENAADGGTKGASCDGFKNSTGITDDKITLGNASDISGPVPGIFESAQQATRAYIDYFNSTSDICGRKLALSLYDSRSDAGANQQAYTKACSEVFAMVGSMSAFDSGGVTEAQNCGLPDIRSTTTSPERTSCSVCFATQAVNPAYVNGGYVKYFSAKEPEATQHVGLLYINAGSAAPNAAYFKSAWERAGWKVDVFAGIDVSEFNYSSYVQQLKDKGVELVSYVGPYQNTVKLQQAMQQQAYEPEVFLQDATIYDSGYVESAGSVAKNTYVYSTTDLFDNFKNKEMALYRSWLDQVSPGAVPNYYGLYAWSATRLFVEKAVALGGKLDRAGIVAAMKSVKDWTGNGLHVPQQVGSKLTANCAAIFQLSGGKWSKISGSGYVCGDRIKAN